VVLLGDQCDVPAEIAQRQLDQADAADAHLAGARPVDSGQQSPKRRLAGAARSHHRESLSRRDREVDAVQHIVAVAIGEPHPSRVETFVPRLPPGWCPVVRHLSDTEQPSERRTPYLELVEPGQQPVEWLDELLDIERCRSHLAE
jgi:hypothetical protein